MMPLEYLMKYDSIKESAQAETKPDTADYQRALCPILHVRTPLLWPRTKTPHDYLVRWQIDSNTRSGGLSCLSACCYAVNAVPALAAPC